ncbi:hypothetical protein Tsubulata_031803 [Turnera subulata]|uniref:Uncharacterized protein n=1 Tax=Turnera subulata TaxID=218843 RepID=A0A9Q0JPI3_9ROSI|nr:hypothetical protein Tsubulata_031803 [Turnera subulata]
MALSSRLQPLASKINKASLSPELSGLKSSSTSPVSASPRRLSRFSRLVFQCLYDSLLRGNLL